MNRRSRCLAAALGVLLAASGCRPQPRGKGAFVAEAGEPAGVGSPAPAEPRRAPPPAGDNTRPPLAGAPAARGAAKLDQGSPRGRDEPEASLRTALSTEPVKSELGHSSGTVLDGSIGPDSARRVEASLARPDDEGLGRPTPPLRYLSPAGLKRLPQSWERLTQDRFLPKASRFLQDFVSSQTAAAIDPPPWSGINADMPRIAFMEPVMAGSYRLQVATSADCSSPLIDRVYAFVEEIDLHRDLAARGAADGVYWVRVAFIDLLDFQQPFGAARVYRFKR
ncbi:MAG: hypothetical protein PHF00_06255 [Elusimicrobia bacterium]|nr:hypothetical protein [Elusimicrobiota bacterium]